MNAEMSALNLMCSVNSSFSATAAIVTSSLIIFSVTSSLVPHRYDGFTVCDNCT